MSITRPAPLQPTPAATPVKARPAPFAWASRRPVLAAVALIAVIVLLAVWTGQDPYAAREDCLARQGSPEVVNAALQQVECRPAGEAADDGVRR